MGGRGKYELHSVLQYKIEIEKIRQAEFVEVQKRHTEKQAVIAQTEADMVLATADYRQQQTEGISIDDLIIHTTYLHALREKLNTLNEELCDIEVELDEKRQLLAVANSERNAFERLEQKFLERQLKTIHKKEADFMDELASQKGNKQ